MLKVLSASLIATVLLTGCSSMVIKNGFMTDCEKSNSSGYCSCVYDEMEKAYSEEEIEAFVLERKTPRGFMELTIPCYIEHEENRGF